MTYWGFTDAEVTPPGADAGIDIRATGALAQVKFEAAQVGRPTLQRLLGARGLQVTTELLFFSGAGYALTARTYAEEVGVALFQYALDGGMAPCSTAAFGITSRAIEQARLAEAARKDDMPPEPDAAVQDFAELAPAGDSDEHVAAETPLDAEWLQWALWLCQVFESNGDIPWRSAIFDTPSRGAPAMVQILDNSDERQGWKGCWASMNGLMSDPDLSALGWEFEEHNDGTIGWTTDGSSIETVIYRCAATLCNGLKMRPRDLVKSSDWELG